MIVGLVNVDSVIPNLQLMVQSAWHKAQGDHVEIASPLDAEKYDLIRMFKVFDFTVDEMTPWPCDVIRGGTGYSLDSVSPAPDTTCPDYAIAGCGYALGRITRGCPRRCPWCVVWRQDGRVRQVAELEDFWRGQDRLSLLDDNLTAMPDLFASTCELLAKLEVSVKFEALDVRFMDAAAARALSRVKRWGRAHFAFDDTAQEQQVKRGIAALKAGGFPLSQATFYVLIGYGTGGLEDWLYRVELLDKLGVESYAMPFDKSDLLQARFCRWVNAKPAFRSCSFGHYNANARAMKGAKTAEIDWSVND